MKVNVPIRDFVQIFKRDISIHKIVVQIQSKIQGISCKYIYIGFFYNSIFTELKRKKKIRLLRISDLKNHSLSYFQNPSNSKFRFCCTVIINQICALVKVLFLHSKSCRKKKQRYFCILMAAK